MGRSGEEVRREGRLTLHGRIAGLVAGLLLATPSWAELTGRVVAVHDGDTITVFVAGRGIRVRLAGIDAPERGQPFSNASRHALEAQVAGREVRVVERGRDGYGRVLGRVYAGPVDVNAEQVRAGFAWVFRRFESDPKLLALQVEAKAAQRGLWREPKPVPPWVWRERQALQPTRMAAAQTGLRKPARRRTPMNADATLFPGFATHRIATSGASIHCVTGGDGPPLLLLHGYPQTHAIWHKVAPRLAEDFTVVCADLRGYGDSDKPKGDPAHATYSKRAMAQDMIEVMRALRFPRFRLAGHDRGGRVSHRLAVDHPDAVERLAVLDISPTRTMFAQTSAAFASAYYHWFFLSQPFDHPERMIGADPLYYLRHKIKAWSGRPSHFDPRALAEYERCFVDPAAIHGSCEDYRAAASIDLVHDDEDIAAGRKVTCPLLALWGERGVVHRLFKPLEDWAQVASDVRGRALPCAHYLAEEAPEETLAEFASFFRG